MSYEDGMPYDAVFEVVEGQVDLEMDAKFQNQSRNVGSQRLAIPAGVARVMATWAHSGQSVRIQWGPITTEGGIAVTSWSGGAVLNASEGVATEMITLPTVYGGLVRVQTVGGVPNESTMSAKPILGLEVFPSPGTLDRAAI